MPRSRQTDPRERLVLALDLATADEALRLADRLRPELQWVKVGLQLFGAAGPDVVRRLVSMGLRVFVDLKLHDIPNTMAQAMRAIAGLGAEMATVHTVAGPRALAATMEAALETGPAGPRGTRIEVLGVTVLTSLDDTELTTILGRPTSAAERVRRLADLAMDAGLDGLVASPQEVAPLRAALGPEPLLVIPGIRPAGSEASDQSRVATPAQALRAGADRLVIGRPITEAPDPRAAMLRILDEMSAAQ